MSDGREVERRVAHRRQDQPRAHLFDRQPVDVKRRFGSDGFVARREKRLGDQFDQVGRARPQDYLVHFEAVALRKFFPEVVSAAVGVEVDTVEAPADGFERLGRRPQRVLVRGQLDCGVPQLALHLFNGLAGRVWPNAARPRGKKFLDGNSRHEVRSPGPPSGRGRVGRALPGYPIGRPSSFSTGRLPTPSDSGTGPAQGPGPSETLSGLVLTLPPLARCAQTCAGPDGSGPPRA